MWKGPVLGAWIHPGRPTGRGGLVEGYSKSVAVASGGTAIGDKSKDGAEPGIPAGSGVGWITGEVAMEIEGAGIVQVGGMGKLFDEDMVAVAVAVCEVGPKLGLWNQ